MASYIIHVHRRSSTFLLSLFGCLVICAATAQAQPGLNSAKARMQDMDKRELQLRTPGKAKRKDNDPRTRAVMEQVNEDFQRLLTLHNELVRSILKNDVTNYQLISNATGEIKKRATRLQSTLELHKPEAPAIPSDIRNRDSAPTKEDLTLLCKKIEDFIHNPIIETPGTIDVLQLEYARRDLEGVVELSAAITKRADKQKH